MMKKHLASCRLTIIPQKDVKMLRKVITPKVDGGD